MSDQTKKRCAERAELAELETRLVEAQTAPALQDLHDRLVARQAELPEVQFTADEIRAIFADD